MTDKAALERARKYTEIIINTIREGLLILRTDLRVQSSNQAFLRNFHVEREETEGRLIYDLGNGQWNIPRLRHLLEEIVPRNQTVSNFEVKHEFEAIGRRTMLLNARRLDDYERILIAIEDVTHRTRAEEDQEAFANMLKKRVDERTAEVRDLALALTLAEQQERRRIAQLLHDDLQQGLYAIQMKMKSLTREANRGENVRLSNELSTAEHWIESAINSARHLAIDLSPPVLKEKDLTKTLRWLIQHMKRMQNLSVKLQAERPFTVPDEGIRVLMFQVVRELLFNVVKHAETDRARIEVYSEERCLLIRVIDEGRGFNPEVEEKKRKDGFGIANLADRLGLIGGHMEIDSAPGQGTRVTIHAPTALG